MIRCSVLANGLTVVTEAMPAVRSVALGFWVGIGSRDEPDHRAGASHFLEHLLFKGTEARTAHSIAEAVDEVGGDMNAFTGRENTSFELRLLSEHLDLGLDILSDIMWSPSFRPDEVDAERQVILEELRLSGDEPDEEVHDLLLEALFPAHPLGRNVLGTETSVGAMTREDIRAFHDTHYLPGVVVVAAAGGVDHDALVEHVERRASTREGGVVPVRTPPPPGQRGVVVRERSTEQAHLVVGMRGPSATDGDRHALGVINHVLGGGLSSRLFEEIRERRGLAYNVYSYRAAFSDAGAVGVYAGTSPKQAATVLELIHAELDRFRDTGITARELHLAKSNIRGAFVLGLEDSDSRMARLARNLLELGTVRPIDDVVADIEALTLDDVNRVAHEVFSVERVLAAVGPLSDRDLVS